VCYSLNFEGQNEAAGLKPSKNQTNLPWQSEMENNIYKWLMNMLQITIYFCLTFFLLFLDAV
jgi:hypothetical protein